jgi:hypothetical protein
MNRPVCAEDIVVLPDDNGTLPAAALQAILSSDAYPETTDYTQSIEYLDFEMHGKPFTQVVILLRPKTPRLHNGREIVVIAGEGGKDNGNAFLTTYEKKEGVGPFLAKRGITFAAVPRLGRWNFFDPDGHWKGIPLGDRMPIFTRHDEAYWSRADYTSHASQGQASSTGSNTYRLPVPGSALYDHMLAATPDVIVEGYRRGALHALQKIRKKPEEVMLLYWGFSTGGPFLWALCRHLTPAGMLGWASSNTAISYYYTRTLQDRYDWGYENSVLRVRERGRPDFRFYTEYLDDVTRERLWHEALNAPNFKSIEDTMMFFNVAAITEQAGRLWRSDFLPDEDRAAGYSAFIQKIMLPCFPADELKDVAVWEMNGTLDQVIQPDKVDAARAVMEQHCKRYRVARLEGYYHNIMHDTMKTVGRVWLKVIESGHFD